MYEVITVNTAEVRFYAVIEVPLVSMITDSENISFSNVRENNAV